jgi:anti-sigma regulatory factor (Ser/Thr protein kinase)
MGFGAGMGLPNMKKYADKLEVVTEVGKGTEVILTILFS